MTHPVRDCHDVRKSPVIASCVYYSPFSFRSSALLHRNREHKTLVQIILSYDRKRELFSDLSLSLISVCTASYRVLVTVVVFFFLNPPLVICRVAAFICVKTAIFVPTETVYDLKY